MDDLLLPQACVTKSASGLENIAYSQIRLRHVCGAMCQGPGEKEPLLHYVSPEAWGDDKERHQSVLRVGDADPARRSLSLEKSKHRHQSVLSKMPGRPISGPETLLHNIENFLC